MCYRKVGTIFTLVALSTVLAGSAHEVGAIFAVLAFSTMPATMAMEVQWYEGPQPEGLHPDLVLLARAWGSTDFAS